MPSSGSSLTRPGRSSSMGKARTSVGPSFSIHCSLRVAMVCSSTALMHSSASGCTRIRSMTKRLSAASRVTSRSWPDSLRTSMLIGGPGPSPTGVAGGRDAAVGRAGRGPCVELVVRRDDLADQLVTDHVVGGQPLERDVLDLAEDPLDHAQTGLHAPRQVDLGD